jgi:hypothetical protein
MPVISNYGELNQWILNHIFRWSLSTNILWLTVFGNMPSGNQLDFVKMHTLTNDARELAH